METITIYVQARKFQHENEFTIEYSTTKSKSNDYTIYILVETLKVEVPKITASNEVLTLEQVEQLREVKSKLQAEAQVQINNIDEQINSLLAIEHKDAA